MHAAHTHAHTSVGHMCPTYPRCRAVAPNTHHAVHYSLQTTNVMLLRASEAALWPQLAANLAKAVGTLGKVQSEVLFIGELVDGAALPAGFKLHFHGSVTYDEPHAKSTFIKLHASESDCACFLMAPTAPLSTECPCPAFCIPAVETVVETALILKFESFSAMGKNFNRPVLVANPKFEPNKETIRSMEDGKAFVLTREQLWGA